VILRDTADRHLYGDKKRIPSGHLNFRGVPSPLAANHCHDEVFGEPVLLILTPSSVVFQ